LNFKAKIPKNQHNTNFRKNPGIRSKREAKPTKPVPNPKKGSSSQRRTQKSHKTSQSSASKPACFRQETARTRPNRANSRHGCGVSAEARARAHLGHTAGRTSQRLQETNQIKPISHQETNLSMPPRPHESSNSAREGEKWVRSKQARTYRW